jgi:hypothetical protein
MKISEAIYNGLTNLGSSIERTTKAKQNHELESIKLGLISDEVKLRMLKQDLYNANRLGKDTEELRKSIQLLRGEVNIQNKADANLFNNSVGFLSNILSTAIVVGSIFWFDSEVHRICPRLDSPFCNQMRQIDRYFNGDNSPLLPDNTGK